MRLPIAFAIALLTGPAFAQPAPPQQAAPQTLGDHDKACEAGEQKACAEAERMRAAIGQGMDRTGASPPLITSTGSVPKPPPTPAQR